MNFISNIKLVTICINSSISAIYIRTIKDWNSSEIEITNIMRHLGKLVMDKDDSFLMQKYLHDLKIVFHVASEYPVIRFKLWCFVAEDYTQKISVLCILYDVCGCLLRFSCVILINDRYAIMKQIITFYVSISRHITTPFPHFWWPVMYLTRYYHVQSSLFLQRWVLLGGNFL